MTSPSHEQQLSRDTNLFGLFREGCAGVIKGHTAATAASPHHHHQQQLCANLAGALEWIRRHENDLATFFRLVHSFPESIHDTALNSLWYFLQPYLERIKTLTETLTKFPCSQSPTQTHPAQMGGCCEALINKSNQENRDFMMSQKRSKRVFFCCQRPDRCESTQLTKVDILVNTLLPYCYVRTNSSLYAMRFAAPKDTTYGVIDCDVFIFMLNKSTIMDRDCLQLLLQASRANISIIMVKDPGFQLPEEFPSVVSQVETTCQNSLYASDTCSPHLTISSIDERLSRTKGSPLTEVIREANESAIVYTLDFHEACVTKLFERLDYILGGESFPQEEVTVSKKVPPISSSKTDILTNRTRGSNNHNNERFTPYLGLGDWNVTARCLSAELPKKHKSKTSKLAAAKGALLPPLLKKHLGNQSPSRSDRNAQQQGNPGQARSGTSSHRRNRCFDMTDSDDEGPSMGTAYLLLRKPGINPEVVHYHPDLYCRRASTISTTDEDSDNSITIEICPSEFDLRSNSTTPEP